MPFYGVDVELGVVVVGVGAVPVGAAGAAAGTAPVGVVDAAAFAFMMAFNSASSCPMTAID
jgi:hypothetical protein